MPPYAMWLRGAADIGAWMTGPGAECEGSRLLPVAANGTIAYGQYRADPAGGHAGWALQFPETRDGKIVAVSSFLDVADLFPSFGLALHLP